MKQPSVRAAIMADRRRWACGRRCAVNPSQVIGLWATEPNSLYFKSWFPSKCSWKCVRQHHHLRTCPCSPLPKCVRVCVCGWEACTSHTFFTMTHSPLPFALIHPFPLVLQLLFIRFDCRRAKQKILPITGNTRLEKQNRKNKWRKCAVIHQPKAM